MATNPIAKSDPKNAVHSGPADLLDRVEEQLNAGRPQEALDLLARSGQASQAVQNALAVCYLRMGQADRAIEVLRPIVFPGGSVCVGVGTPTIYQTNYALAMLAKGNILAAKGIYDQILDRDHPAVKRLGEALRAWRRSAGLVRRLLCLAGAYPTDAPVTLDGQPGDVR